MKNKVAIFGEPSHGKAALCNSLCGTKDYFQFEDLSTTKEKLKIHKGSTNSICDPNTEVYCFPDHSQEENLDIFVEFLKLILTIDDARFNMFIFVLQPTTTKEDRNFFRRLLQFLGISSLPYIFLIQTQEDHSQKQLNTEEFGKFTTIIKEDFKKDLNIESLFKTFSENNQRISHKSQEEHKEEDPKFFEDVKRMIKGVGLYLEFDINFISNPLKPNSKLKVLCEELNKKLLRGNREGESSEKLELLKIILGKELNKAKPIFKAFKSASSPLLQNIVKYFTGTENTSEEFTLIDDALKILEEVYSESNPGYFSSSPSDKVFTEELDRKLFDKIEDSLNTKIFSITSKKIPEEYFSRENYKAYRLPFLETGSWTMRVKSRMTGIASGALQRIHSHDFENNKGILVDALQIICIYYLFPLKEK